MFAFYPRPRRSNRRSFIRAFIAPVAVVAMVLALLGSDLAGNAAFGATTEPTPTGQSVIDGSFRPIELPVKTVESPEGPVGVPPTRDVVETLPTDDAVPTEEAIPAETPTETEPLEVIPVDDTGDGSIAVRKYYCPEGTESGLTLEAYVSTCTEPMKDTTFTLVDGTGFHVQGTNPDIGGIFWQNVVIGQEGELQIQEEIPVEYADPVVYCGMEGEAPVLMSSANGFVIPQPSAVPFYYLCHWFNIPAERPDSNVIELWKHYCPVGTGDALTLADYTVLCSEPILPTTFTLTDPDGSYPHMTDATGYTRWLNVTTTGGTVAIAEDLPVGYGTPMVFCTYEGQQPEQVPATDGYLHLSLVSAEFRMLCQVFNIPMADDPGSLTILKYTCPENYDLHAPGADPYVDCPTLTDGVTFILDDGQQGLDPGGVTGDNGPGTTTFVNVEPGDYTVEEVLDPGMGDPFVLECVGSVPQLQPYPLWSGNNLPITINAGEAIACHWFNVPLGDPDLGTLTVTKHICTTAAFVSDIDCGIYEGGQTFDLLSWDSVQWNVIATETTDVTGRIVWTDLPIGHYRVAEHGATWCHFESSALLANDYSFNINHQGGMDQTVDVWNCGADPGTNDEIPTTYPNTGAGASDSSIRLASSGGRRTSPVEGDAVATPPVSRCLPSDDTAATTGDALCPRGAVPVAIRIDAIGVDAPIEVKETVDGVMQQPSGETAVAWYKEGARLGEPGNMLLAGHLNWWGVPEAVFFSLGSVREGDEIVLTDASGMAWTYRVAWVRQESSLAPASADVVGPTAEPAITLMTCGGEWNAEAGIYDERTVVRAVLVDGPE
ncbi:MAG: sortase [Thermomicrobiales bacterium]